MACATTPGSRLWQKQRETGQTVHRSGRDSALVGQHNRLGDGQAQPGSFSGRTLARRVGPVKTLKQMRQVFGGNGVTRVDNRHLDELSLGSQPHLYTAAGWGVAQGVGEQVAQGAAQHQPVTPGVGLPGALQLDAALVSQRLVKLEQITHFTGQIDRFRLNQGLRRRVCVVGLGQKQHVGDHAGQPFKLLGVGLQNLAVTGCVAVPGQGDLCLCHQVAHRGAQLVRDVGGKVGEAAKRFLQPRQHFIEGVGQVGQLRRYRIGGQALVQALCGHPFGAGPHGPQGCQPTLRGKPAQ